MDTTAAGTYDFVLDRARRLMDSIAEACLRHGRPEGAARLMAVTKTHPWEAVEAAVRAGVPLVGENRVQEMAARFPLQWPWPGLSELHFIGHLQKNKIKKVVGRVSCIQSVDDVETLLLLEKALASGYEVQGDTDPAMGDACLDVMFEYNTSGEDSKNGIRSTEDLHGMAEAMAGCPHLRLRGLMTLGPLGGTAAEQAAAFSLLRKLAEELRDDFGLRDCRDLSMGMSNDWEAAVAEGSTIVRIGTALFGSRS